MYIEFRQGIAAKRNVVNTRALILQRPGEAHCSTFAWAGRQTDYYGTESQSVKGLLTSVTYIQS
jgi:hypothetical protein